MAEISSFNQGCKSMLNIGGDDLAELIIFRYLGGCKLAIQLLALDYQLSVLSIPSAQWRTHKLTKWSPQPGVWG